MSVRFPAIEPTRVVCSMWVTGMKLIGRVAETRRAPRHFSCTVVLVRAARQVSGASSIRAFIEPYCSTSAGLGAVGH